MEIFTLHENNKGLVSDFVPKEITDRVGEEGYYTIGLFDESMNMEPAGFLQFYAGFLEEGKSTLALDIDWLFVKEEYRYEKGGAMLIDSVVQIAGKSGAGRVTVNLPEDVDEVVPEQENDSADREPFSDMVELKRCFLAQGFVFDGKTGTLKTWL